METKLKISGFKCFYNDEFHLKKVTLLTGSNGTGKSSLIQSILLARIGIEKNFNINHNKDYSNFNDLKETLVPLNNGYNLRLGTIYDIIREKENKDNQIIINLGNETYKFNIPDNYEDNTSLKMTFDEKILLNETPFWRKKEFYYLHTERLGPRHLLEINFTDFIHCGFQGEYTAQVLVNVAQNTGFTSAMIPEKNNRLEQLVNQWLELICPGALISAYPVSSMSAQIKVRGRSNKSEMLATNIGFGISYVLPIIVTGLIAKKGSVFIVENPEAHLHPKGQSNIGYFLGKVAEAGVKVIIETHSEHVVNGVRIASLKSENLKPSDINIYFFDGFDDDLQLKKTKIEIQPNGDLSDFPVDFFDQIRQDLLQILKITSK